MRIVLQFNEILILFSLKFVFNFGSVCEGTTNQFIGVVYHSHEKRFVKQNIVSLHLFWEMNEV